MDITLGFLINNQERFNEIRNQKISGKNIFSIRKKLKPFTEELKEWEELRSNYIKENAKSKDESGNPVIKEKDEELPIFLNWANEVFASKLEKSKVPFTKSEIEEFNLSDIDLDFLSEIGLYNEEEVEKIDEK